MSKKITLTVDDSGNLHHIALLYDLLTDNVDYEAITDYVSAVHYIVDLLREKVLEAREDLSTDEDGWQWFQDVAGLCRWRILAKVLSRTALDIEEVCKLFEEKVKSRRDQ